MNETQKLILAASFAVLAAFVAMSPSLENGFVNVDDPALLTQNAKVTAGLSARNIKTIFSSFDYSLYHPLVTLSFALEYRFFKFDPAPYHATNLLLHLCNVLLVLGILYATFGDLLLAALVAALFGVHPLNAEPAAWISGRKDLLYAFFFLLSLGAYVRYLKKGRAGYVFASFALFVLSLLAKPAAVTLPLVLLLWDYLLTRVNARAIVGKIPFAAVSIAFALLAHQSFYVSGGAGHYLAVSAETLKNAVIAHAGILFYIGKTLIPRSLCALYPHLEWPSRPFMTLTLYSPLIVWAGAALALYSLKRTRKVLFGVLFFLLTIAPGLYLLLSGVGFVADRYLYLPSVGIFFVLAAAVSRLYGVLRGRPVLKAGLAAVLVAVIGTLSFAGRQRCRVWENGVTMYGDIIRGNPHNAEAYCGRGDLYGLDKEYDRAIADYSAALRIRPDHARAYHQRAVAHFQKKEYDRARDDAVKARSLGYAVDREFLRQLM